MSEKPRDSVTNRVRMDLTEAEVDSAFGLVALALEEYQAGNIPLAHRALHEADDLLNEIGMRLQQLDVERSGAFVPLVEELRKAVQAAHAECHG